MKKKQKKDLRYWISNAALLCCIIVFFVSLWKLAGYLNEYKKGEEIYEELNEAVVLPEDSEEKEDNKKEDKKAEDKAPQVDSEKLLSINPDYVGWLYIADSVIDYPVVKGIDNDRYLHRTFTGEKNNCGCIFIDMENENDFSSRHTVLHGHNMKNGSMFGTLRYYDDKEYWEDHSYLWIVTPEKVLKYQIFASCRTTSISEMYDKTFHSDEEFQNFLDLCDSNKEYDTGVKVGVEDRILTLSTCTSDTEEGRRIVQAKLVSEEEIADEE